MSLFTLNLAYILKGLKQRSLEISIKVEITIDEATLQKSCCELIIQRILTNFILRKKHSRF